MSFVVSNAAYVCALLHAHHHGGLSIFGVLLGTRDEKGKKKEERVVECLGIGHGVIMSPLLEVALEQVRMYGKERGLDVLGCYVGNEVSCLFVVV
jgi:hypothetical protein